MPDYSNLGLDQFLRSVDSLAVKAGTHQSYMDYDWEAITANKARSASLNNLKGGTITLGGTNNGDGVFLIEDSSGSVRVRATNGSMMMYDDIGREQFRLVYSDQLVRINSLDIGGTSPTNSGQIRLYDSGTLLFTQIDVTGGALFDVDTRIGDNYGITIGGTATQPAPTANRCTMYIDNGGAGGKNRLMAIFDTGVAQVVAQEP